MKTLFSLLNTVALTSTLALGFAAAPMTLSFDGAKPSFQAAAAFARRGADDPAGHVRHGRGRDDAPGHVRGGHGADDAAGDDHGGKSANDDHGGKGGKSGKSSNSGRSGGGKGGHDDGSNHH